ncbi:M20/M25/M40 family metallo-hydrolase [Streptomyces sp. NPDC010273]|uniref:M20/M25/M40 family metallo-hydrolase n=1 Tax=Streptomyces sp. NPDC010273 TaxID=3364829 RepID=UPI0036EE334A
MLHDRLPRVARGHGDHGHGQPGRSPPHRHPGHPHLTRTAHPTCARRDHRRAWPHHPEVIPRRACGLDGRPRRPAETGAVGTHGGENPGAAREALTRHLADAAPWGAKVTVETEGTGSPFRAATDGPAYTALGTAMEEVYGKPLAYLGQGGSIPLCNVLAETYPRAEIILMGVEEPRCLIHAPNESVDPTEIEHMAHVEALFLTEFAKVRPH